MVTVVQPTPDSRWQIPDVVDPDAELSSNMTLYFNSSTTVEARLVAENAPNVSGRRWRATTGD